MYKVGVSFCSTLSATEVREKVIRPLRAALKAAQAGIYTNYLRQVDPRAAEATEHLLVFEIRDFKAGLRVLRVELENLGLPGEIQLHNLNPSTPGY